MRSVDLSRLSGCTIHRLKLVDLMLLSEFQSRVNAYAGIIDDAWVCRTAVKVEQQLRTSPALAQRILEQYGESSLRSRKAKYHRCHHVVKYLRVQYPQYFTEKIGTDFNAEKSKNEIDSGFDLTEGTS